MRLSRLDITLYGHDESLTLSFWSWKKPFQWTIAIDASYDMLQQFPVLLFYVDAIKLTKAGMRWGCCKSVGNVADYSKVVLMRHPCCFCSYAKAWPL